MVSHIYYLFLFLTMFGLSDKTIYKKMYMY